MTVLHIIGAFVCFAAVMLYADRSAYLVAGGSQGWAANMTRIGIGLWMAANCAAFIDLAVAGSPFVWRHWLVLLAMSLAVAGHLGLRLGGNRSPT